MDHADLLRLTQNTSWLFPAGDWTDIRPHLPVLYSLARWVNAPHYGVPDKLSHPPRCFEIGVRQGPSTLALLLAMRETNGSLLSIDFDPVETAVAQRLVAEAELSPWWHFELAHSDLFELPESHQQLDLLWIDGEHHHPQPTQDFTRYAPHVRANGMIVLHDYYLEPWRMDENEDGVRRCVEEVIRPSGQYEWCVLPWSYGLTIVRKLF